MATLSQHPPLTQEVRYVDSTSLQGAGGFFLIEREKRSRPQVVTSSPGRLILRPGVGLHSVRQ